MEKLKKYKWPIFLIFINIFILIFLKTSPIYNGIIIGESDHSIYHVISKQMTNGKILYKDVFDHKGPLIFFIYYIANISKFPNLIYFIIDTLILNSIFILNKKTINLKSNNIICYTFTIIQMFFIIACFKIACPESIMLLTICYLNHWVLSKQYLNPTKTQLIICGILTGLIFWIKFSLGVYIALIYFYFIFTHIKNKTFNYKYILIPLIGFLIPTAITFGYFIYNNALKNLIECYFITNAKYKNPSNLEINNNIICLITLIIILTINSIIKKDKNNIIIFISYIMLFITTFLISKNNFKYYFIPFISIIPLTLSMLNQYKIKEIIYKYINISLIIILIFCLFIWNQNTNSFNKSNIYIAEDTLNLDNIIFLFEPNGTILSEIKDTNYKYPITPNLTYEQKPEMWNQILDDVKNKNLEYIVIKVLENDYIFSGIFLKSENTRNIMNEIYINIQKNYNKQKTYPSNMKNINYVLYKRK